MPLHMRCTRGHVASTNEFYTWLEAVKSGFRTWADIFANDGHHLPLCCRQLLMTYCSPDDRLVARAGRRLLVQKQETLYSAGWISVLKPHAWSPMIPGLTNKTTNQKPKQVVEINNSHKPGALELEREKVEHPISNRMGASLTSDIEEEEEDQDRSRGVQIAQYIRSTSTSSVPSISTRSRATMTVAVKPKKKTKKLLLPGKQSCHDDNTTINSTGKITVFESREDTALESDTIKIVKTKIKKPKKQSIQNSKQQQEPLSCCSDGCLTENDALTTMVLDNSESADEKPLKSKKPRTSKKRTHKTMILAEEQAIEREIEDCALSSSSPSLENSMLDTLLGNKQEDDNRTGNTDQSAATTAVNKERKERKKHIKKSTMHVSLKLPTEASMLTMNENMDLHCGHPIENQMGTSLESDTSVLPPPQQAPRPRGRPRGSTKKKMQEIQQQQCQQLDSEKEGKHHHHQPDEFATENNTLENRKHSIRMSVSQVCDTEDGEEHALAHNDAESEQVENSLENSLENDQQKIMQDIDPTTTTTTIITTTTTTTTAMCKTKKSKTNRKKKETLLPFLHQEQLDNTVECCSSSSDYADDDVNHQNKDIKINDSGGNHIVVGNEIGVDIVDPSVQKPLKKQQRKRHTSSSTLPSTHETPFQSEVGYPESPIRSKMGSSARRNGKKKYDSTVDSASTDTTMQVDDHVKKEHDVKNKNTPGTVTAVHISERALTFDFDDDDDDGNDDKDNVEDAPIRSEIGYATNVNDSDHSGDNITSAAAMEIMIEDSIAACVRERIQYSASRSDAPIRAKVGYSAAGSTNHSMSSNGLVQKYAQSVKPPYQSRREYSDTARFMRRNVNHRNGHVKHDDDVGHDNNDKKTSDEIIMIDKTKQITPPPPPPPLQQQLQQQPMFVQQNMRVIQQDGTCRPLFTTNLSHGMDSIQHLLTLQQQQQQYNNNNVNEKAFEIDRQKSFYSCDDDQNPTELIMWLYASDDQQHVSSVLDAVTTMRWTDVYHFQTVSLVLYGLVVIDRSWIEQVYPWLGKQRKLTIMMEEFTPTIGPLSSSSSSSLSTFPGLHQTNIPQQLPLQLTVDLSLLYVWSTERTVYSFLVDPQTRSGNNDCRNESQEMKINKPVLLLLTGHRFNKSGNASLLHHLFGGGNDETTTMSMTPVGKTNKNMFRSHCISMLASRSGMNYNGLVQPPWCVLASEFLKNCRQ